MNGRYIGLNRGPDAVAMHNRTVPADQEADACRCPSCRPDLHSPSAAAQVAEPAAALLACPADARQPSLSPRSPMDGRAQQRGPMRGPVQDESGRVDPIDAIAMRAVEGRTIIHDMIDAGAPL